MFQLEKEAAKCFVCMTETRLTRIDSHGKPGTLIQSNYKEPSKTVS